MCFSNIFLRMCWHRVTYNRYFVPLAYSKIWIVASNEQINSTDLLDDVVMMIVMMSKQVG